MKQCSKCGKENSDDSLFCSKCGDELIGINNTVVDYNTSEQKSNKIIPKKKKNTSPYLRYWLYSIPVIFLFTLLLKSIMSVTEPEKKAPAISTETKLSEDKENVSTKAEEQPRFDVKGTYISDEGGTLFVEKDMVGLAFQGTIRYFEMKFLERGQAADSYELTYRQTKHKSVAVFRTNLVTIGTTNRNGDVLYHTFKKTINDSSHIN